MAGELGIDQDSCAMRSVSIMAGTKVGDKRAPRSSDTKERLGKNCLCRLHDTARRLWLVPLGHSGYVRDVMVP